MKKVVILESLGISDEELKGFQQPFEGEAEFLSYPKTTDIPALKEEVKDAHALILANMPLPEEVIEAARQLEFIDVAFTGVDHVGLSAARARNIPVSNASGYSNEAVAELVLGMALSLLRNIPQVQDRVRAGATKEGLVGGELKGKTVGIIGFGKIGSRTGELMQAFGAKVLATRHKSTAPFPDYVEEAGMEDLLKRSDIVVLHCPLNDSTRGLMDHEKLSLMKPSALLINVARGPVVVEKDLVRALEEGLIAGAGIDVFDIEPPLPLDTPLLAAPRTLLTPHVAFATRQSMTLRAEIVFENLRAWLEGKPQNLV